MDDQQHAADAIDAKEALVHQKMTKVPATLSRNGTLADDEASRLQDLAAGVRDQDDLERDINRQADELLIEQADERDRKRLEKTTAERDKVQTQLHRLQARQDRNQGASSGLRLRNDISKLEADLWSLEEDLKQIQGRVNERHELGAGQDGQDSADGGTRRLPNESQREFLIRTGKITPFSKLAAHGLSRADSTLQGALLDAEEDGKESVDRDIQESEQEQQPASHRHLLRPGFDVQERSETEDEVMQEQLGPRKRRRLQRRHEQNDDDVKEDYNGLSATSELGANKAIVSQESTVESEDEYLEDSDVQVKHSRGKDMVKTRNSASVKEDISKLDDGNEMVYQSRLEDWTRRRRLARTKLKSRNPNGEEDYSGSDNEALEASPRSQGDEEEWCLPHPTVKSTSFDGGYKIPGDIFPSLFDYQKTGVRWLWELYSQQVGGIVGDEMGLGKTIQIISFLAGLHHSKKLKGPILVIAPATVMKQWVNEFHTWWPAFRVSILHTSGSGMMDLTREIHEEDELLTRLPQQATKTRLTGPQKAAKRIVDRVVEKGHVLVTTYSGLQTYAPLLIPIEWGYAVLDEGHKIRNPNAAITIYCKELRTPNRIILSGTPMQNNLVELWSLFDFVFPLRLGTLINFRNQFEFPIRQGGYANASNLQIQTAMKCAETLKDAISPYLLQRFKADVAADLPKKSEQVLFCKLTKVQRDAYENFLSSDDLKSIMNGKRQVLYGVDILRKICNHPDLVEHRTLSTKIGYNYGSGAKAGKMQVVKALLELWSEQGHKTLLFAQHRIMLDILEKFLANMPTIKFCRMDGTTAIHVRQSLVDDFNRSPDLHVFLLTTKVGGLGVNLTGADRVIIYDPDWNPSTDVQARERAWRLGQKREVMIYRLMTAGTIEEKIYHRQLFKQFLINKILRDPKQRQTFQMKDLHDLFALGGANDLVTETGDMFKGTETRFKSAQSTNPAAAIEESSENISEQGLMAAEVSSVNNVTGVAHVEKFQSNEDSAQERQLNQNGEDTNSDSRVMESIFARSGVQAALEHDQIVNGKKVIAADPAIIEKEARRVAAQAAKELRQAAETARTVPIGVPTWTGTYGSAGRPTNSSTMKTEIKQQGHSDDHGAANTGSLMQTNRARGRGGPSSASILAGLQQRQNPLSQIGRKNHVQGKASALSIAKTAQGPDFITMIRDYLVAHDGAVYTQMLIDHFNRFCNTPAKTAQFKAILSELATLQTGRRGRGRWTLKDEFRVKSS